MRKIAILQLGDVHYPRLKNHRTIDYKDKGLSPGLVEAISGYPLQQVVRKVIERLNQLGKSTLIAQCGDISEGGDLDGYHKCVEYLVSALDLAGRNSDYLHAVPGNHDVDRQLSNQEDLFAKFVSLEEAWKAHSVPILYAREVRSVRPRVFSDVEFLTIGANSCVGSGERRALPKEILGHFPPSTNSDHEGYDRLTELVDAPAFDESHLRAISEQLQVAPNTHIALVIAHHPLLPQTIPRIDIYAELLNAGVARSRLSKAGYPVIYLHGHVHDDPVEVLTVGAGYQGSLVMVAAPLLSDGFNEICLYLSQSGYAIGCELTKWRRESDGIVRNSKVERIPLVPLVRRWMSNLAVEISHEVATGGPYRFEQLRSKIEGRLGSQSRDEIIDGLLEAEWAGNLTITDRSELDEKHWTIESRWK